MAWIFMIPPDPVFWVWPRNFPEPCEIPLGEELLSETYVTSPPYPYYLFESLAATVAMEVGRTQGVVYEAMGASFSMDAGTLRTLLLEYDHEPETLAVSFAMEDGTFRTILKEYTTEPETLAVAFSLESGTFETKRVTNDAPPEMLAVSFSMEDGTLETP